MKLEEDQDRRHRIPDGTSCGYPSRLHKKATDMVTRVAKHERQGRHERVVVCTAIDLYPQYEVYRTIPPQSNICKMSELSPSIKLIKRQNPYIGSVP